MPSATAITLAASAVQTASGTGAAVDLGTATTAFVTLDVTAVSGTSPAMTVTIETSATQAAWRPLGALAASLAGTTTVTYPGCDRYVRARWTITGTTPSFTFAVLGSALLVYATPADQQRFGVSASGAFTAASVDQRDGALRSATDVANGYLSAAFTLPITAWADDLRRAVIAIADYDLICQRGYNPDGGDAVFRDRFTDAISWLKSVAAGSVQPAGIKDSTPDTFEAGAVVYSRPRRGYAAY